MRSLWTPGCYNAYAINICSCRITGLCLRCTSPPRATESARCSRPWLQPHRRPASFTCTGSGRLFTGNAAAQHKAACSALVAPAAGPTPRGPAGQNCSLVGGEKAPRGAHFPLLTARSAAQTKGGQLCARVRIPGTSPQQHALLAQCEELGSPDDACSGLKATETPTLTP